MENLKVIRGGLLIDGNGSPPVKNGALLIAGSQLAWVGPQRDLEIPDGASPEVFDYPNGTLLPGLVDAHTHMNFPGDGSLIEDLEEETDELLLLRSVMNAKKHLESGVTTARENGARNKTGLSLKEGIERGFVPGPKLVSCGRPITIRGGHCWTMGGEADGTEGMRQAVRQLVKEQVDFIKVMTTGGGTKTSFPFLPAYSVEELSALVDEAHKFGKLVGAHATATQGIINALDAGADMIIHCSFNDSDGTYRYDPKVAERIAETGTWVNLTIYVGLARIHALERQSRESGLDETEVALLDQLKRVHEASMKGSNQLIQAGAKIAPGSDAGWRSYPLGHFQKELVALCDLDISTMQAIVSGTKESAKSIGVGNSVGTLESGKQADVLVTAGNPLETLDALSSVEAVFKDGVHVK